MFARPLPTYRLTQDHAVPVKGLSGVRTYHKIVLVSGENDRLSFTLSLPTEPLPQRLPVVVIMGGFGGGDWILNWIPRHSFNAVVSYDYPYVREHWEKGSKLSRTRIAWRVARRIPDQVPALIAWTVRQDWADSRRVSLVGLSLGAVALPLVHRRTVTAGVALGLSVLAYGGAGLARLARANLRIRPAWFCAFLARFIAVLLHPFEPARHLPHLRGEFLIINGLEDQRVPAESAHSMHCLTPEPKTLIQLPGPHIDGDRQRYIRAVALIRNWLLARGAVNP